MTPTPQPSFSEPADPMLESRIGRILLEMGKIKPGDAERILRRQKDAGLRFGEAAESLGLITQADIQQVLARQFDYPYVMPGQGKLDAGLVAAYEPFCSQVETLRAVRSQLMLRWFAENRKALVIASINPKEGTSLFAANLAVVFSQLGEQTLLVDANLRRPHQDRIFNISEKQGLSDLLVRRANLSIATKIEFFGDLSVLQAGTPPPNPQELICRDTFTEFALELNKVYEIVLFDVPSFSDGADALGIAARVGGVLLVVRKNWTAVADVIAISEQLTRTGVVLVGTVLVDF